MAYQDKVQESINEAVQYLTQVNCKHNAEAVAAAAGQVLAYENGDILTHPYSKRVNRHLCESLFIMNSDPNCSLNNIRLVRRLIESYRDMNGMPTDSFEDDIAIIDVPDDSESSFGELAKTVAPEVEEKAAAPVVSINGLDSCNEIVSQFIYDNTELGEEYAVEDIIDEFLASANDPQNTADYKYRANTQVDVLDALKSLVKAGIFEVTEREDWNGTISAVLRVR